MTLCAAHGRENCRSVKCLVAARKAKKPKKSLEQHRKYSKTEKGRTTRKAVTHRRRSRERAVEKNFTQEDWSKAVEYFDHKCAYCEGSASLHHEHFVPLALGGSYTKENIVPSCRRCNTAKKDYDPLEWLLTREHGLVTYARVFAYLTM